MVDCSNFCFAKNKEFFDQTGVERVLTNKRFSGSASASSLTKVFLVSVSASLTIIVSILIFGVLNALSFGIVDSLSGGLPLEASVILGVSLVILMLSVLGIIYLKEGVSQKLFFRRFTLGLATEKDREQVCDLFDKSLHIKDSVKKSVLAIEERLICLSPELTAQAISKVHHYWPTDGKVEYLYRESADLGVKQRGERERMIILLGFLTRLELSELCSLLDGENVSLDPECCRVLYAKFIKMYPQLVAAEVAFFVWLKKAFPYQFQASAACFVSASEYRKSFFENLRAFVRRFGNKDIHNLFDRFSGLIPACLAVFQTFPHTQGMLVCPENEGWDWNFYCEKVCELCRETVFYGKAFGDAEVLRDFVRRGSKSLSFKQAPIQFSYGRWDRDFFDEPESLWDLGVLCKEDPELALRVEEGLCFLNRCGYLGGYFVEDLKEFERKVLGIKKDN
ncbi:hypothetical protein [Chlamydiifrater phoenicopteri]|uniref:hypothetical protein n=1 Tax=Chlamydiifrater phoenicopteri TaxID=2681469 RepID=UPI001BD08BD1|nr:hypothetical protein [Chlamydiifrater phoenicopteri]